MRAIGIVSLGLLLASSAAQAVEVAADGECRVLLTKVGYDDPGVDDAEVIELRVQDAPMPGATLGDCGLERIEHINGASGGQCGALIRSLELDTVNVAEDGYVLICTGDGCQVNPGSDGWLQNGPDALRFIDARGTVTVQVDWGGDPNACLDISQQVSRYALEKEIPGQKDDVNLWCEDGFERVLFETSPLRAPNACPLDPPPSGGTGGGAAAGGASGGAGAAAGGASAGSPGLAGMGSGGEAGEPQLGYGGAGGTGFWPAPPTAGSDAGAEQPHTETPHTGGQGGSPGPAPSSVPAPRRESCQLSPGGGGAPWLAACGCLLAVLGSYRRRVSMRAHRGAAAPGTACLGPRASNARR